ncbi:hypothetical protein [Cupriavidus oxalaticus]|uniref:Uncharacterized protein n=1 Tax=Cupriavidus oxalaticus TaxID=96344 RepID=A0A5P3VJ01_9BURK|nr:hypothetical protein [Cupriavidus oxalaticus]QEZ46220.1 hypothetical protein D2917_18245 [Cupriavidus oxalaticus]
MILGSPPTPIPWSEETLPARITRRLKWQEIEQCTYNEAYRLAIRARVLDPEAFDKQVADFIESRRGIV